MDAITAKTGIKRAFSGENAECSGPVMWRPWDTTCVQHEALKVCANHRELHDAKHSKSLPMTHPVKLYWPKSKCFDYLYQDAEVLLRNYPVQATICLYEEEESGDEDSDEEEENLEKEMN